MQVILDVTERSREFIWRRGWDSNPRATYAAAGFQDRCFQPLSHPSNQRIYLSIFAFSTHRTSASVTAFGAVLYPENSFGRFARRVAASTSRSSCFWM